MPTPPTQPRLGDQEACEELDEIRLDVEALTGHPIEVRPVPYGRGVFAKRHFAPGEVVLSAEIQHRVPARTDTSFEMWPGGVHAELTFPASRINHSCDPNCGVSDNRQGGYDFIAGPYGIAAGEEIRTHYGFHEWRSRAVGGGSCRCGAPTCAGRSRGWGELTPTERDVFAEFPVANHLRDPQIVRGYIVGIQLLGVLQAPETVGGWRGFVRRLCAHLSVRQHGDLILHDYGSGIHAGWTWTQHIDASAITGHFYRATHQGWIDIVSCRPFDADRAAHWASQVLCATAYHVTETERAA